MKIRGAAKFAGEAVDILTLTSDRFLTALAYQCLGLSLGVLNHYDSSQDSFNQALEIRIELGNTAMEGDCFLAMANSLLIHGDMACISKFREARASRAGRRLSCGIFTVRFLFINIVQEQTCSLTG